MKFSRVLRYFIPLVVEFLHQWIKALLSLYNGVDVDTSWRDSLQGHCRGGSVLCYTQWWLQPQLGMCYG
eukprot:5308884-Ditylum_brightwellii.AAC.1